MKKKTLIGIGLVLLVSLLVGCGGVSQDEYDAVIADKDAALTQETSLQSQLTTANTTKTKAETDLVAATAAKAKAEADLATAQAALTKANSDLSASKAQFTTLTAQVATLKAQVTALEKEVADLKAAAGGGGGGTITPPKLSFTAATYTDTTYKFTFKYDASWTATWNSATNPVSFGNAQYYDPSVRVYRYPKALGATLADVIKTNDFMTGINTADPPKTPVIGTTAEKTNVYGTKVTAITHQYTNTNASIAYFQSYGFLQGDYWFILSLTENAAWGITNLNGIYPDEVFSTWQFTQ
jgi:hypothetical protein